MPKSLYSYLFHFQLARVYLTQEQESNLLAKNE